MDTRVLDAPTKTALGLILRDLRLRSGWTQVELAERLGASKQAVSAWEAGRALPPIERLWDAYALLDGTVSIRVETSAAPDAPLDAERTEAHALIDRLSAEAVSALLPTLRLAAGVKKT